MTALGAYIRKRRKSLGLSQSELAAYVGCGQAVISELEKGYIANPRRWRMLAKALSTDPENIRQLMQHTNGELGIKARHVRYDVRGDTTPRRVVVYLSRDDIEALKEIEHVPVIGSILNRIAHKVEQ